jgi:GDP/UDP-N,N'-diacetylbacillosamine 2-epimerase (hydrolysing)
MSRRVCVVTGSRAEYGLLFWLMKEIEAHSELELQVIATGMHLSPEFGLTVQEIEKDGFNINGRVEMLLSSDTPVGVTKSIGIGVIGFADEISRLQPDIIVLLGDRFEIFAAAQAALVARIPIAHIHGGEITEGAVDEAFRHAITKMSHLHFTSTEEYRSRVIQLGENPDKVFTVGAAALDNIHRLSFLNKVDLERELGLSLGQRALMVTFHPATLDNTDPKEQFEELLYALDKFPDISLIFTKSNADANGRAIGLMIDDYVRRNGKRATAHTSLGYVRYLSALSHVSGVIGNSSSGLIEAPSFKIGTVNVGDRQRGRVRGRSVIDCAPNRDSIVAALNQLFSDEFQLGLYKLKNPYGDEPVAKRVVSELASQNIRGITKKHFYSTLNGD